MKIIHESIVCIGECMVEMTPTKDGSYTMGYAGDTFNTAWYLRGALPLSWNIRYMTALGDDTASRQMIEFMEHAGVSTEHIIQTANKSAGLYMIHLSDGERSFSYWRDNAAARDLANDPEKLDRAMRTAGIVYFSGITVAILRKDGRSNLFNALKRARANGSIIVFDPNLRPRLWESTDVMRREIMRAAAISDIILPSYDDEVTYFIDANPQATVDRYLRAGAGLVVLKNGGGELLADGPDIEPVFYTPTTNESPLDTTAAGDSFNAGFLSDYLINSDVRRALAAGAALSAQVINQTGALVETS